MTSNRAWVLLPSGQRLDLLAPDPVAWTDRDLAISLSRAYRWGGHSQWDLPLSVAQHSLLVLILRQQMQPFQKLTPAETLRELLHDAEEAFLCFDPISPLKPHLGDAFSTVTGRLRSAINTRYQLAPWSRDDYRLHKKADHLAAASEAFHVTGWSRAEMRDSLQIMLDPVDHDPLPTPDGMQPWQPWPPRLAGAVFLAKLQELTGPSQSDDPGNLTGAIQLETRISALAESFNRLPPGQRRNCAVPVTGSSLSDTYVLAEAHDGSECVEGVVIDGHRDEAGSWDFDADFTIFTTDEEILVCHGYSCHVEIQ